MCLINFLTLIDVSYQIPQQIPYHQLCIHVPSILLIYNRMDTFLTHLIYILNNESIVVLLRFYL